MLSQSQLAGARRIREAAMVDACTIRTPNSTPGTFDTTTGTWTTTQSGAYYSGACRVLDSSSSVARDVLAAEQQVTLSSYMVELPESAISPHVGDLVTVTVSQDPWLVGRVLTVKQVRGLTYASSRVLVCTDDLEEA